jgi:hypothetical protein
VVLAVVLGLLFYKPGRYNPFVADGGGANNGEVHPYLSHDLGPEFYNGAQSQQPYEVVVLDEGLNEILGQQQWSQQSEGVRLYAPAILFAPGRIVLMGTADIEGAEFVVTVEIAPMLDEEGLLNLDVAKVKVGAMNVTPLARMLAKKMYLERLETEPIDTEDLRTKIVASLLNGEPFDPVFKAEDKWVRLDGFDIAQGQLTARFVPARQP